MSQQNFSAKINAATLRLHWETTGITHSFLIYNAEIYSVYINYRHKPGVEKCSVQEAAVVVVANKVSRDSLPCARLWHVLIGHCDPVSGVVEVQKHDVKHQGRLSWDVAAWREKKSKGWWQEGRRVWKRGWDEQEKNSLFIYLFIYLFLISGN